MSNVTVLSKSKVDKEATACAHDIYNAQAIIRVCMAVIDDDNGVKLDRHTVWRALKVADQLLQVTGDTTAELALRD
jgi:hypothetical protein